MDDSNFESYWRARIDRIKDAVPIAQALYDLGYNVHPHNNDHEWQFSCDLHGSGQDLKPSARLYPDDNSFYCFGCRKQRDVIELVRDKEGLSMAEACRTLETRYKLGPFQWEGEFPWKAAEAKKWRPEKDRPVRGYDDEFKRVSIFLETILTERSLDMSTTIRLFEALDAIGFLRWQEQRSKPDSSGARFVPKLQEIHQRAMEKLRAKAQAKTMP